MYFYFQKPASKAQAEESSDDSSEESSDEEEVNILSQSGINAALGSSLNLIWEFNVIQETPAKGAAPAKEAFGPTKERNKMLR